MDEEIKKDKDDRIIELLENLLEETRDNNAKAEKYSYFAVAFALVSIVASTVAVSFSIQSATDNLVEKILVPLILLGVVFCLFYVVFRDLPWVKKD
tara:strand:- start:321 stop:608 length:288 start_codon:yes stop_codon:yes gene_type:complete